MSNTFKPEHLPPIGSYELREIRRRLDGGGDAVVIARRSERGLRAGQEYCVTRDGGDGSSLSLTSFGDFCAPWSWRSGWLGASLFHYVWSDEGLSSSHLAYLRWRASSGWQTTVFAREDFWIGQMNFTKGRAYRIVIDGEKQMPNDILLLDSLLLLTKTAFEVPRRLLTVYSSGLQEQHVVEKPDPESRADTTPLGLYSELYEFVERLFEDSQLDLGYREEAEKLLARARGGHTTGQSNR